jgi:arylsulfatase A-like enzyme
MLRHALPESLIVSTANLSAVATLPVFERLAEDLAEAQPGSLYYAHMMVPHSPYAYDAECEVRPMRDWLTNSAGHGMLMSNSSKSIAARVPLYLEQLECTNRQVARLFDRMREAGVFDDTVILVHGDHGSRIAKYDGRVGRTELLARYSTLFALRAPGQRTGTERSVVPIHDLLDTFVHEGTLPRRIETPKSRRIFVEDGHSAETGVIATRTMPRF